MILTLASKSLLNRKGSVLLTIIAISVSLFVLLAVDHLRQQTKQGFASTISGTDLVVGSRTSSINLLLYSIFHIGTPTANLSWKAYQNFNSHPQIAWTIPISLGDSHKGYRVMGTNDDFFLHYNFGNKHPLSFSAGDKFNDTFDVVLGSEVAQQLNYKINDPIVLSHGLVSTSFSNHDQYPFKIIGILNSTGTPVDQTLYVTLKGIEAIHKNWQNGKKQNEDLTPKNITAFMLGLTSRMATFDVQRDINQYAQEPLTAILPGVALSELWHIMGSVEQVLKLISYLVILASLLGLSAMLVASINERRQEIHLLRIIGAPPSYIFLIIELEAILIALIGTGLSLLTLTSALIAFQSTLTAEFGLHLSANLFSMNNLLILGLVQIAAIIAAAIPAAMAYRSAQHSIKH